MKVVVKVESVNEDGKKMILSARNEESRIDVSRSLPGDMASDKWIQGVVQNTAPFGVFIRPAGMDTTGMQALVSPKGLYFTIIHCYRTSSQLSNPTRPYGCIEEDGSYPSWNKQNRRRNVILSWRYFQNSCTKY